MSPEEMRAELVSLLSDGVLRYLTKRKVDRGHRRPQFSEESVDGAFGAASTSAFKCAIWFINLRLN
jgi:hypothetical protein